MSWFALPCNGRFESLILVATLWLAEVVLQVVTQGYNTWKNADNQLGILCQTF